MEGATSQLRRVLDLDLDLDILNAMSSSPSLSESLDALDLLRTISPGFSDSSLPMVRSVFVVYDDLSYLWNKTLKSVFRQLTSRGGD